MKIILNNPTKAIFKRELKNYFHTPIGYVFLIIFLFAQGYITFEPGKGSFFLLRQADLRPFFFTIPWMFILFVPAISMRLWAEERRSGTIELLLTLPVSVIDAVLGKFLAAWIFLIISLLLTFPMIITVFYLGSPDLVVIILGYIGASLVAGVMLSIGCFFSSLSKNQVISFIFTSVFSYFMLMAGSPPVLEFLSSFLPTFFVELIENLSIMNHYESMQLGVLRLSDLLFFVFMILGWLLATFLMLQEKKTE
ncbi:MAG: ABC transporter permease [Oligoflexia bacterium]|nr:ABC transporter permease [Oligoflexia bacterium]